VTNYIALAFFAVVGSNLTSSEGRWTLALFVPVVAMMAGGWHFVRGRVDGALLDRVLDEEAAADGGQALSAGGER
ncbi:MAG: L-asparagine permease, partial [Peptidiphaga gingivicola]